MELRYQVDESDVPAAGVVVLTRSGRVWRSLGRIVSWCVGLFVVVFVGGSLLTGDVEWFATETLKGFGQWLLWLPVIVLLPSVRGRARSRPSPPRSDA